MHFVAESSPCTSDPLHWNHILGICCTSKYTGATFSIQSGSAHEDASAAGTNTTSAVCSKLILQLLPFCEDNTILLSDDSTNCRISKMDSLSLQYLYGVHCTATAQKISICEEWKSLWPWRGHCVVASLEAKHTGKDTASNLFIAHRAREVVQGESVADFWDKYLILYI